MKHLNHMPIPALSLQPPQNPTNWLKNAILTIFHCFLPEKRDFDYFEMFFFFFAKMARL